MSFTSGKKVEKQVDESDDVMPLQVVEALGKRSIAISGLGYLSINFEESERIRAKIRKKQNELDLEEFQDQEKVGEIQVFSPENAEITWEA